MIADYRFFCKENANERNESYFQIAECSFSSAKIRFSSERCKDFPENV